MVAKKEKEIKLTYVFMHVNKCVSVCLRHVRQFQFCSHFTDGKKVEMVTDFTFWAFKSLWTMTEAMKLKVTCFMVEKL